MLFGDRDSPRVVELNSRRAARSKPAGGPRSANRSAPTKAEAHASVRNVYDPAWDKPIASAGSVVLYWSSHRASYTPPARRISCRGYAEPPWAAPVFHHATGVNISTPIHFLFDLLANFAVFNCTTDARRTDSNASRQTPWNGGMGHVQSSRRGIRRAIPTVDHPALIVMGEDQMDV